MQLCVTPTAIADDSWMHGTVGWLGLEGISRGQFAVHSRKSAINRLGRGLGRCGAPEMIQLGPQKPTHIQDPSGLFVFIHEHPDSLEFVSFWVDQGSCPSGLHGGGATVSFADGHVEAHRWESEQTRVPVTYEFRLSASWSERGSPDLRWLQDRTQYEP